MTMKSPPKRYCFMVPASQETRTKRTPSILHRAKDELQWIHIPPYLSRSASLMEWLRVYNEMDRRRRLQDIMFGSEDLLMQQPATEKFRDAISLSSFVKRWSDSNRERTANDKGRRQMKCICIASPRLLMTAKAIQ